MENTQELIDKNDAVLRQVFEQQFQIWMDHIVFTWRWWIGVIVIIICLGVWIWLRKKRCSDRLFYAGFFVAFTATFLDSFGEYFGIWTQQYEVFPAFAYLPWDAFMLPTIIMLLLLFKPHIHPLLKALLLGAFTSFIGLPLMSWLDIYEPTHWKFIYSLPIQMVIYLLAHFFSRRKHFDFL
ncbi:CBO0543 family protein [Halobacillus hunanensis]|uniref:CBO0543 family protein n=1 Tax=Halobacillus hunanensis TaxID=578214 RepID=UPI0009A6EC53|nr:CBO0543 family protein [Halobacillus hunanensis]